ncbi:MAG: thiol oxidoreductase-like protein [Planctomycetes bacterium]|nr:thiol oxidoreductase-like protein [Planctomycetota bacterium]
MCGVGRLGMLLLAPWFAAATAAAQLTDLTQTPNAAGAGIAKSLEQEIGPGRGDVLTPGSSRFLIARDPFRSIRRGRQLFQRKFTAAQGVGPRTGDGVGDIEGDASCGAGLADSCASCHGRPRGAAGFGGDVFTRPDSRDAPHLFGLGLQEMLADEITKDLRTTRTKAIVLAHGQGISVTLPLRSKGIGYGFITALPDGSVLTGGVEGVDPDLRVRPFFAQGATISIREFIVGACNAEMGLEAPDPDLLAASEGEIVTTPAGMVLNGKSDRIEAPPVKTPGADPDGDGVANEIDTAVVDHLEFYLLNYFKPAIGRQSDAAREGRRVFEDIGCAACHVPDLLVRRDRRVADVETTFDPLNGIFNRLFATATGRFTNVDDGSGFPTRKGPSLRPFLVRNILADFKRHDLGPNFHERNFDGSVTTHFLTEPLWGVASTAPYGHDGRSTNLEEVILRHGGEALSARNTFAAMHAVQQTQLMAFLGTLVLFPPDDTASNLDPGDPATIGFPQFGHGSVKLTALFNNPSDIE